MWKHGERILHVLFGDPLIWNLLAASRGDGLLSIALRILRWARLRTRAMAFWTKLVKELLGPMKCASHYAFLHRPARFEIYMKTIIHS